MALVIPIDWVTVFGREVVKLAEALAERSDCQIRLADLQKRLVRSARVQEGDKPVEDTVELMKEVERTFDHQLYLVSAINRTNAQTEFDDRLSISDAIAKRDVLGKKRDLLKAVADAASVRQDRSTKSEVKFVASFSVAKLQHEIDQLAKEFRILDTRLQELNWRTELT